MATLYILCVVWGLLLIALIALAAYETCLVYSFYKGVPYVSTGASKSDRMMTLAGVGEGTKVIDLGSGDGEICFAAARRGALATGFEANPILVGIARWRAKRRGVDARVHFVRADLWTVPFPKDTDVVCAYLLPKLYGRLWEKLRRELVPGTKVVSHAFKFPDVSPEKEDDGLYLYTI